MYRVGIINLHNFRIFWNFIIYKILYVIHRYVTVVTYFQIYHFSPDSLFVLSSFFLFDMISCSYSVISKCMHIFLRIILQCTLGLDIMEIMHFKLMPHM